MCHCSFAWTWVAKRARKALASVEKPFRFSTLRRRMRGIGNKATKHVTQVWGVWSLPFPPWLWVHMDWTYGIREPLDLCNGYILTRISGIHGRRAQVVPAVFCQLSTHKKAGNYQLQSMAYEALSPSSACRGEAGNLQRRGFGKMDTRSWVPLVRRPARCSQRLLDANLPGDSTSAITVNRLPPVTF